MKITTEGIGNYSNYSVKNNRKHEELKQDKEKIISDEEKKFFAELYPENKDEIMDYHFYQRSGQLNGVKLGTMFDKKG